MMLAVAIFLQFGFFSFGGNPWYPPVQPPPERFDHGVRGAWHVIVMPQPRLDELCRSGHVLACTAHLNGCTTWINPINKDYAPLLRHERAHCNGWPGDHPL